jgi:uncharacterized protein YgiB involved in biofilm formation
LRTSSKASGGRPDPTWAPVKGLEPNEFNRDDHDANALQYQFKAALEAADPNATAHGETAHGETAHGETDNSETASETARWETALKANPHDAIRQAKFANCIREFQNAECIRCS